MILAERMVPFGKDQVHWSCTECLQSQGTIVAREPVVRTIRRFYQDQRAHTQRATGHHMEKIADTIGLQTRSSYDYWFYLATLNSAGSRSWSGTRLFRQSPAMC
jgi:hypothetical protein